MQEEASVEEQEVADITSVDDIVAGRDLTEAEIQSILNRIDLTIYNIIDPAKKWASVPYNEHGSEGHSKDPAKQLDALRNLRGFYHEMLNSVPSYQVSQWDDPSL